MLLSKETKLINYRSVPTVPLTQFDDADIAFVVGVIHPRYKALCVTKAGGFFASPLTPQQLCDQLDAAWVHYSLWTHHDFHTAWVNLTTTAPVAVVKQLKQFQGPMRVASCGKRSFWSPRPYYKQGVWFFTPACQHIVLHDKAVTFTTQAHGQEIHWAAFDEHDRRLPVRPETLAALMHYVDQKAAIIQAFAHQESAELLRDQEIVVPGFEFSHRQSLYPLPAILFQQDVDFIGHTLLGEHYLPATKARADQLVAWANREKEDKKTNANDSPQNNS